MGPLWAPRPTNAKQERQLWSFFLEMMQMKEGSDDEDMEDESESDAEVAETAKFESRSVAHGAAVNRVRCMHQQPGIVAVWGDNASVAVLNLSRTLTELAEGGGAAGAGAAGGKGKGRGPKQIQVRTRAAVASCAVRAARHTVVLLACVGVVCGLWVCPVINYCRRYMLNLVGCHRQLSDQSCIDTHIFRFRYI